MPVIDIYISKDSNDLIYQLFISMRILPHHQDTGGFFVAVLEKVKALPWEGKSNDKQSFEEQATENISSSDKKRSLEDYRKSGPQRRKRRKFGFKEDPFVFFKDDTEDVWASIK